MKEHESIAWEIKAYLKIYAEHGLVSNESTSKDEYEVLDGNTIMEMISQFTFKMHKFHTVFGPNVSIAQVVASITEIDDLFDGFSHTLIVVTNEENKLNLAIGIEYENAGTNEHYGMFIELFNQIYTERKQQYFKKVPTISMSIFSSIGKSNKVVDLLNGQMYTFRSKKDIDANKMFAQKEISEYREFLIALKIAEIRHKNCCDMKDTIVIRLNVLNECEESDTHWSSSLHVVFVHPHDRVCLELLKTVGAVNAPASVDQNDCLGSIGDYFGKFLLNTKITILTAVLNQAEQFKQIIEDLPVITASRGVLVYIKPKLLHPLSYFKKNEPKGEIDFANFSIKEMNSLKKLFACFKKFGKEHKDKLEEYYQTIKEIDYIREEFYEAQRFPVSVEIKESETKLFFNARIFTLCENYQMTNLEPYFERLKTLKNRILVSLKALYKTETNNFSPHFQSFLKTFERCLKYIQLRLKILFEAQVKEYKDLNFDYSTISPEKILTNQWILSCDERLKHHFFEANNRKENSFTLRQLVDQFPLITCRQNVNRSDVYEQKLEEKSLFLPKLCIIPKMNKVTNMPKPKFFPLHEIEKKHNRFTF